MLLQLASTRGHGKFMLLKDQDLNKLHQLASGNRSDDQVDAVAMQFLVDSEHVNERGGALQKFLRTASSTWAVSGEAQYDWDISNSDFLSHHP